MNPLLKHILPLLIAPLSIAQAAEKAGFPLFTWDKVPVYQMFADSDRLLTDGEVAQISATSSFICIEKQHGSSTLGGADLGTKHEVPRFKALNPATKCLFYFNSAYPELNKPLGKPLGDFTRSAPDGWIFKREFEHASVRLDLTAREGEIDWK